MTARFTPPFPDPHPRKSRFFMRFVRGWNSWIHVLFDRSYTMKMGEIHTPAQSFYIANELSLVKRIMVEQPDLFPKHAFMQDVLDPLIGNSVFSANGKEWADQRAMVNPAYGHTALKGVFAPMVAAVDALVGRMRALDLAAPVAIDPLMTHVAADIIFRTIFSQPIDTEQSGIIHRAFHRYQESAQRGSMLTIYGLPRLGFRRRAEKQAKRIHAAFAGLVHDRLHGGERREDILQAFIDARHPDTGAPFDEDELMRQVATVFLAGHETAASAMTWALYLLACDPASQDAVRAEAGPGPLAYEDLRRLAATRNVFRETLRLYPPIAFMTREVTCPVTMRDKELKPGAMLVVSPWLIQRNRDHFRDPHGFDPDRFDDPAQAAACREAYLPFGKGPRVCMGAGFAQQEALLVLAGIVRAFRLEPVAGDVPEPVSRLTLRPRRGVRLRLTAI